MTSLVIRGGTVVTASDTYRGDIAVTDGRIEQIAADIDIHAEQVVDASGCYVMPGGVDGHTHIDLPYRGVVTCDDFTSGTRAAAAGGTTTVVDFCMQESGQSLLAALDGWHAKLEKAPPAIDVGFHLAVIDLNDEARIAELPQAVDRGVTSFKLFLSYVGSLMVDDATVTKAMFAARDCGALVMVHAENGCCIDVLIQRSIAAGRTSVLDHARTHPPRAESEATHRAIALAEITGCSLEVVHMSCATAVEHVAAARRVGAPVWGETCPHYLLLDQSRLAQNTNEAAKYVMSPPLRTHADQAALWSALETGVLSFVSSDHSPYQWPDQKVIDHTDFTQIRNGVPGIQERIPLLYTYGVEHGRISLNQLVDLVSTTPARAFGLYPRKGTVAIGSDADLIIIDPAHRENISARRLASHCNYSLYEGWEVAGQPRDVFSRGRQLVANHRLLDVSPRGEFLSRLPVETQPWPNPPADHVPEAKG